MFSVDQLDRFQATNPDYKLIKPWWDVLLDYISTALLVIAILAGAIQATQTNLVCLPAVDCNLSRNQSSPTSETNVCKGHTINNYSASSKNTRTTTLLLKLQDRRQYDYVEAECSYRFYSFSLYFPIIIFFLTVFLIVAHNVWLKLPQTTSVIDHFISLVNECHSTPMLNRVVWDRSISKGIECKGDTSKSNQNTEATIEQVPLVEITNTDEGSISTSTSGTLDISVAFKTKALCEKASNFRKKVETKHYIYWLYFAQAIAQLLLSSSIIGVNIYFLVKLKRNINCTIEDVLTENSRYFKCTNILIAYFRCVHVTSILLAVPYLILCIYMLSWTLKNRVYNFVSESKDALTDIPTAKGNLGFLLQLLNKYNKLYSLRFSEFLSERNEVMLKDHILMSEWPLEKLNSSAKHGGRTLKLSNLFGVPKTVFQMRDLRELILENCNLGDDQDGDDWAKLNLRSLSLVRCGLSDIPSVILRMNSLETLDLSYNNIKAIPIEFSDLKSLCSLNVAHNDISYGVENLFSMKTLVKLNLRGNNSFNLRLEDTQPIYQMRLEVSESMMELMDQTTRERLSEIVKPSEQDLVVIKYSPERLPLENPNVLKMISKPKGVAVIINNSSHSTTSRSRKDMSRLRKLFEEIGYRVSEVSSTHVQTQDLLGSKVFIMSKDCSQCDSAIFMMTSSYNDEGGLTLGLGEKIKCNDIANWMSKVRSLEGKPKLIFIQTRLHESVAKTSFSLPMVIEYRDTLIANFESHGTHGSFREMEADSFFVHTLVDVFSNYAWREDVDSLLARVDDKLSMSDYKFVSSPRNGLKKKFYFLPGYFEGDGQGNENLKHPGL